MTKLIILVDYDNVSSNHKIAGAVGLAKVILDTVDSSVLASYTAVTVRMYGGWRSGSRYTTFAQRLLPQIRNDSPSIFSLKHGDAIVNLRLVVELADYPIGTQSALLEETFVRDRNLRNFRSRSFPLSSCANTGTCGMVGLINLTASTQCDEPGCAKTIGDVFVRDEQKMVDTLMVADIAYQALVAKTQHVIIVSSDTDMWPGVVLALQAGRDVIHIHTTPAWRTQRHLMNTISGRLGNSYKQTWI